MNKKIIAAVATILVACGIILVIVIRNNTVHQSENVFGNTVAVDEGMYYINSLNFLVFMDPDTGDTVPVCSRADCTHDTIDCDAYYPDVYAQNIIAYDDSIYISYFTIERYTDSDGSEAQSITSVIETSDKDGTNRKVIYEEEAGAVLSMLAVDGKLYFTAYKRPTESIDEESYYYDDNMLFCYDMDWGNTKELLRYEGNDTYYHGGLYLLPSESNEQLYIYNHYANNTEIKEDGDPPYYNEYTVLDLEGNEISSVIIPYSFYCSESVFYIMADDNAYISITEISDTQDIEASRDIETIYKYNSDGTMTELASVENGDIMDEGSGWFLLVTDDTNRLLFDSVEGKFYLSKSAFSDEHMPLDIYAIDSENDIIYIDATDYTGVDEDTVFAYDPTQPACMSFSEYLDTYFVSADGEQLTGFSISEGR